MSWDFSTDPDFQEQLDWMREFLRTEIWPLESIWHELDVDGLRRDAAEVAVAAQDPAQRCGDLPLGQDAGRALVEQRLEQVVRRPVDEGHRHGRAAQCAGGEQPAETAADDHHAARTAAALTRGHGGPLPLSRPGHARRAARPAAGRPRRDPSCPVRKGAPGWRRRGSGRRWSTWLPRCPGGRTATGPRPGPRR